MKKSFLFLICVIMLIALFNCGNKNSANSSQVDGAMTKTVDLENVDYNTDVKPIIANRCDKCHAGSSTKFADLSEPGMIEEITEVIEEDIMPKDRPLASDQKQVVLAWLASLD